MFYKHFLIFECWYKFYFLFIFLLSDRVSILHFIWLWICDSSGTAFLILWVTGIRQFPGLFCCLVKGILTWGRWHLIALIYISFMNSTIVASLYSINTVDTKQGEMNPLHYIVWQGFLEDNTWPVLWNLACSQHNVGFYYYRWITLCWCKIGKKYGQNDVKNALLSVSLWGARCDYQCVIAWRGLKCHVRQLTMNWKKWDQWDERSPESNLRWW